MKLAVVTICMNEAKTIEELINRIPKKVPGIDKIEVHLIDDGSQDATAEIARRAGARVHSDGSNRGLAFRFREAVNIVLDSDADIMVNIDGDLQFSPEDIPKLVQGVVKGEYDFVAADRFTDPKTGRPHQPDNMPSVKYWGNRVGAAIVSRLSGKKLNDVTCGFRAYNRRALFALNTNGSHTYTQESFQVLAAKRFRILTVPTKVKYFKDRKSRVVKSIPKYIVVSGINILRAFRDFAPLKFFVTLGNLPFVLGLVCLVFLGVHWINTGDLSPYKFVGFSGIYLVTLGIFLWSLGILADMLVRVLNNQEKILEEVKRVRHKD